MTPYQEFNRLLYAAHDASEAVDRFDLHEENPASAATFEELLKQQRAAYAALIGHVLRHGNTLLDKA